MRIKFSPYSLNTFLQCSEKYYFTYEDEYVKQHRAEFKQAKPYLTLGDMVHRVLHAYFGYPAEERSWELLGRLLQRQWPAALGTSGGFETVEQERDYYQQAQAMLRKFLTFDQQQPLIEYTGDPENMEAMLQTTIRPDLVLFGRVDRIDREADGLHVIDYKTGKEKHDELQLLIYALLAEGNFDVPVKRVSYFYLQSGKLESIAPDDTLRREAMGRIDQTVATIRTGLHSPKPSLFCQNCEYLKICPARPEIETMLAAGSQPQHQDFFEG